MSLLHIYVHKFSLVCHHHHHCHRHAVHAIFLGSFTECCCDWIRKEIHIKKCTAHSDGDGDKQAPSVVAKRNARKKNEQEKPALSFLHLISGCFDDGDDDENSDPVYCDYWARKG